MFGGRYNRQARGNSKRPHNVPNLKQQDNSSMNVKSGEVEISVKGIVKPRRTMLQSLQQPLDAAIIKNIMQFNVIEQRINQSQAQEIKVLNLAMSPNHHAIISNIAPPGVPSSHIETPPKRLNIPASGDKMMKGFSSPPYSPIPEE